MNIGLHVLNSATDIKALLPTAHIHTNLNLHCELPIAVGYLQFVFEGGHLN